MVGEDLTERETFEQRRGKIKWVRSRENKARPRAGLATPIPSLADGRRLSHHDGVDEQRLGPYAPKA